MGFFSCFPLPMSNKRGGGYTPNYNPYGGYPPNYQMGYQAMYQPYGYYVPVVSTPSTSQPQPPRRERRCKVIITDPKDNNQLELDREKKTLTSSSDANSTAEITENVIDKSVGVV